jgi:thioredoxin
MAAQLQTEIVTCPRCGQKNRVLPGRAGAVCGRCGAELPAGGASASEPAGKPIEVTDTTYTQVVLGSPLPVLLDCWAAWCGPCRAIAPSIERLAVTYAGRARVCKLDVDANPRTAAELGVQGIPALFFLVGGRVVDRLVGAHPYESIEAKLKQVLSRASGSP